MTAHDSIAMSRRELLRNGGSLAAAGLFGLSLPAVLFGRRAAGAAPAEPLYDAVIQVFFEGGPAQTDTLDPKANSLFPTVSLGVNDPDAPGRPLQVTTLLSGMAGLATDPRSGCGLGLVRSLTHGNGEHTNAQLWAHCFAHDALSATLRPSAGACLAHWRRGDAAARGVPGAVVLPDAAGSGANDGKGARLSAALELRPWRAENQTMATASLDAGRAARRRRVAAAVDERLLSTRPDQVVRQWVDAWGDAAAIARGGKLGPAVRPFQSDQDLLLPQLVDPGPLDTTTCFVQGACAVRERDLRRAFLQRLTLAYRLVAEAGVPYVCLGVDGNDAHGTTTDVHYDSAFATARSWRLVDAAVVEMAARFRAQGKRVLFVLGGEFGRTPHLITQNRPFAGRDHWADGFSWGLFSVGGPRRGRFETSSWGSTGADGTGTLRQGTLVRPLRPGAVGALIYRCLGVPVGEAGSELDMQDGRGCPLDPQLATVAGPELMARFGLPRI